MKILTTEMVGQKKNQRKNYIAAKPSPLHILMMKRHIIEIL